MGVDRPDRTYTYILGKFYRDQFLQMLVAPPQGVVMIVSGNPPSKYSK